MTTKNTDVPAPNPAVLTAQELQSILAVIDAATQRAVFKGKELSTVGAIYDRVAQAASAAAQTAGASK